LHHIVQPPRRCGEASLQTSRPLDDEGNIGQSRATETGPQLKPLLERLTILVVRSVFNGDGVVTLADFAVLLQFALPLLGTSSCRGGKWIGDILRDVILQSTIRMSTTILCKSVLGGGSHNY
jgi:hypothetical protein